MRPSFTVPLPPSWTKEAACIHAHYDIFYPPNGVTPTAARAVCAGCPVRVRCLQWALDSETPATRYGVWAGTTPMQRRALAKGRAA